MDEERARYFRQQELELSVGRQATTVHDLLSIRAHNSQYLRDHCVGSAIGLRTVRGQKTNTPAVIAFVAFKVAPRWVPREHLLPRRLEGRGSMWCELDVLEFNPELYDSEKEESPKDTIYNELTDKLRGGTDIIGPGHQLMSSLGKFCSMGPLVVTANPGIEASQGPTGFLSTASLLNGLQDPVGAMLYHPQTPRLGTGTPVGVVKEVKKSVSDFEWYHTFVCEMPDVSVQTDAVYVTFGPDFDLASATCAFRGVPGRVGPLFNVSLEMRPQEIIGKRVAKVGRTTGLTYGNILAYSVEYYVNPARVNLVDFMVTGDGGCEFSKRGDAGSTLFVVHDDPPAVEGPKGGAAPDLWLPLGILWAFSSKCGRAHYGEGAPPSYWSSAVDLARLLDLFHLELQHT